MIKSENPNKIKNDNKGNESGDQPDASTDNKSLGVHTSPISRSR